MTVPLASRPISLWRLERLRLLRTRRWIALGAVFLLLGFGEPLVTSYLGRLLGAGTGSGSSTGYIHISVSTPQPSDAMSAYFGNVGTVGTIVAVVVAAMAFSVRAEPALAGLYLTHVRSRVGLLLPRLVTVAAATGTACALGTAAAAYETALLLGAPAAGATVLGGLVACADLVFAVAVTFLVSTLLREQAAAIAVTLLVVLVAVPFADLVPGFARVGLARFGDLPTALQTAAWTGDDAWATAVTVTATALCVLGGFRCSRRWEL